MRLELTLTPVVPKNVRVVLLCEVFGEPLSVTAECVAGEQEKLINEAIIFLFARKAEKMITTIMDLYPSWSASEKAEVIDKCSLLVIDLDGGGIDGQLSVNQCNDRIQGTTPAFLELVGRKEYSGFSTRRREFDELTHMAALLKKRLAGSGGASCIACLEPLTVLPCPTCSKAAAA